MIRKSLPAAIALASTIGLVGSANAVEVNPNGIGEVLLYPLYTVEGGNDTLVTIVNTTNYVKAVKVRFVESMNSQEVLDFNLYLSPHDVWTGAVIADTEGDGARLLTRDTSCTVPAIPAAGQPFLTFEYEGEAYSNGEGGPQGADRTRVGHLEVIEMGVVQDDVFDADARDEEDIDDTTVIKNDFNPEAWATHGADGVPANCAGLVEAWDPNTNNSNAVWTLTSGAADIIGADEPGTHESVAGGIFGSAIIIDVQEGIDVSYDAVALDNFRTDEIHTDPSTTIPSLEDADKVAVISGQSFTTDTSIDAVSVVLMKSALMNDFVTSNDIAAATDLVVTFPTKRFYVNEWVDVNEDGTMDGLLGADGVEGFYTPGTLPLGDPDLNYLTPFTSAWDNSVVGEVAGSACEPIHIEYWNREERTPLTTAPELVFSPQPDDQEIPGFNLCYEANVIHIDGSNILGAGYASADFALDSTIADGWLRIDLTNLQTKNNIGRTIDVSNGATDSYFEGLPAIGFNVVAFTNGDVGGLLSNYAGLNVNKAAVTSADY